MPSYSELLAVRAPAKTYRWTPRDVKLYALAVGAGSESDLDRRLRLTADDARLEVLPTFLTALAFDSYPSAQSLGIDYRLMLHGEQAITLHRPLAPEGEVVSESRVLGASDKGDKGFTVEVETRLSDARDGSPVAALRSVAFARGGRLVGAPAKVPEPQGAEPEMLGEVSVIRLASCEAQPLVYCLTGDRNPLHWSPEAAIAAGFQRPILHGLCTFAMACRGALATLPPGSAARVSRCSVRFAAPFLPGETLEVSLRGGPRRMEFEASSRERGVVVLSRGRLDFSTTRCGSDCERKAN